MVVPESSHGSAFGNVGQNIDLDNLNGCSDDLMASNILFCGTIRLAVHGSVEAFMVNDYMGPAH